MGSPGGAWGWEGATTFTLTQTNWRCVSSRCTCWAGRARLSRRPGWGASDWVLCTLTSLGRRCWRARFHNLFLFCLLIFVLLFRLLAVIAPICGFFDGLAVHVRMSRLLGLLDIAFGLCRLSSFFTSARLSTGLGTIGAPSPSERCALHGGRLGARHRGDEEDGERHEGEDAATTRARRPAQSLDPEGYGCRVLCLYKWT